MGNNKGVGVHQSYKEEAKNGCDVLFRVKIKGRSTLVEGIPLHMSIKIFKDPSEYDIKEIQRFAKEHDVSSPDPKTLIFKPIIFESEKTKLEYYMLQVDGLGPQYKALYDEYSDVGNVYKKFFTHVTIDKELYEDIKENGLKPEEVEFSHLILEHGAGNTIHDFEKSEVLEKGIKHVATAIGAAAAIATSPAIAKPTSQHVKMPTAQHQMAQPKIHYSSERMLNTISAVETSHGHNMKHKLLHGINAGESAFGKYGLTPNVIRETIHMNGDLKSKHAKAVHLKGDDMRRYMEDNPGLEDVVAKKHLQRLEHHFGHNPAKLGYAWLEGIRGTYRADKEKKDINNHWHAKKITDAYAKEK